MQGIAGFFKSVIKPYSIPIAKGENEPRSSATESESAGKFREEETAPEQTEVKVKTDVVTGMLVEHDASLNDMREMVYDLIKDIRDPEKPQSLEELAVVSEENICLCKFNKESYLIQITFIPTVPHCSLASLIGLCLRKKLMRDFPDKHKLDIFIKEGTHETAEEVNKQINDKERIAAALENPNLRELVDQCISDDYG